MNPITIAVVLFFAIAIIVAVAASIWVYTGKRRTKELRSKFGPEYRRMAVAEGDAAKAEQLLTEREKRVKKLDIQPLTDHQRNGFADEWEHTQAQFVDLKRQLLAVIEDESLKTFAAMNQPARAEGAAA